MRLSFDISDEACALLRTHLRHGSRKYVYKALLEGFAEKLEKDTKHTLAVVVSKQWDIEEFMK
mgnify:CR=1 FL=1